ncbi:MAG: hypothetical protein OXB95_04100 [Rhodobacteraceae bacterium]|nr:hypothetical protein [Paracoccaceae bacterium]
MPWTEVARKLYKAVEGRSQSDLTEAKTSAALRWRVSSARMGSSTEWRRDTTLSFETTRPQC